VKILVWTVAALVILVAVVTVIGWLLPVAHVASRSATFRVPPGDLHAAIADVAAYAQWWPDISRVEMLPSSAGTVRFREHMRGGPIVMEVVESTPPSRFVTKIADPDQPFAGTWTFEIAPHESGSELTITEHGEVYNPIFRFVSRFVFGHTATMDSFLQAAQAKLAP